MNIFEQLESNDRYYCRDYPVVFNRAVGCRLETVDGKAYTDFFCGAGALNYGHNPPALKAALMNYLKADGVVQSLDMFTAAKEAFMKAFYHTILQPRKMSYKMQFCAPTGTNVVEAALKLARKITGRSHIITFTNAFHGMSLGALAMTGSRFHRHGAGLPLCNAVFMPYDGYFGPEVNTIDYIAHYLDDPSSGIDAPAAFIVETVQGEGGINAASAEWLTRLQQLAHHHGSLLIIDDIQAGCGRTGTFFSFEHFGLSPDLICLSKSLSGYGLPLSMLLIKPQHDIWKPGEHNGTFRGPNLGFITGTEALKLWADPKFHQLISKNTTLLNTLLTEMQTDYPSVFKLKGRGMMRGLVFNNPEVAQKLVKVAFAHGLIVETAGPKDEVIKLFPPLTIDSGELERGIQLLDKAIHQIVMGDEV